MKVKNIDWKVKQKYIKQIIGAILFILAISYASEEFIPGRLQLQKKIFIVVALLGILGWVYKNINHVKNKYWMVLVWFCIPFVLTSFYTILICSINGDQIGTAGQAITTSMFLVVDFFVSIALIILFDKSVIKVMTFSVLGAYAYIILFKIQKVGVGSAVRQLLGKELERNDIGVAVVPLILYYLYIFLVKKNKNKSNLFFTGLLFVVMVLCAKRSAILSLAVGIVMILMTKYTNKNATTLLKIISVLTIVFSFLYVVGIHVGAFDQVLAGKGTLSDRLYVWKYFDGMYEISPLYFGKGFSFVHRYMTAGLGDWMVNHYEYLHNSILQLYIETGFWGVFIWTGNYFILIPHIAMKKYGKNACNFTIISIVSMFAMFTVDNNLTYPLYQICLYCSLYSLYRSEELEQKQEMRDKNGYTFGNSN